MSGVSERTIFVAWNYRQHCASSYSTRQYLSRRDQNEVGALGVGLVVSLKVFKTEIMRAGLMYARFQRKNASESPGR